MAVATTKQDIGTAHPMRLFQTTGLTATAILTISNQAVDITVPGVLATDICISVTPGVAATAGLGCMTGRVKAADTITVWFVNPTTGSVNSPTALNFLVAKPV
jgi:hypothetical protein